MSDLLPEREPTDFDRFMLEHRAQIKRNCDHPSCYIWDNYCLKCGKKGVYSPIKRKQSSSQG